MPSLQGKVCLVTGATRGIGKGIALQLGQAGATVYITGRTLKAGVHRLGGSLEETAQEVEARGGKCIPVVCDHSKDSDIQALFEKIKQEQDGQLDVLVNNAFSAVNTVKDNFGKPFWETPLQVWDDLNNVGLRNHYFCTHYAVNLMAPRKRGLIVNISSAGGLRYAFNVAYGIGKEAVDRMAADCAFELRKKNVACVSLWPGVVRTEGIQELSSQATVGAGYSLKSMMETGESTEYPGRCVVHLAADPNVMSKSGKILIGRDLGDEYGFVDIDGKQPAHLRSVSFGLKMLGWKRLSGWIPEWIKVPKSLLALGSNKF